MKLEPYLRVEINQKIRPLYIKERCEHCDCTDDLHLHHKYEFFKIVDDVLKTLNLELKDTNDYTDNELYLIKSCVLAEHLKDNYLTLCSDCHKTVHKNKENRKTGTDSQKRKLSKEQKLQQLAQQRTELLESVLDIEMRSKELKAVIVALEFKSSDNKKITGVKGATPFIESLGYKIIKRKTKKCDLYTIRMV